MVRSLGADQQRCGHQVLESWFPGGFSQRPGPDRLPVVPPVLLETRTEILRQAASRDGKDATSGVDPDYSVRIMYIMTNRRCGI
jgi:hypothetical protein